MLLHRCYCAPAAGQGASSAKTVVRVQPGRSLRRSVQYPYRAAIRQLAQQQRPDALVAAAAIGDSSSTADPWWKRNTLPNMREIHSVQELVDAMCDAGDSLVILDIFAPWCGACRAVYPKFVKLLREYPDIVFLKINFEENKQLCKQLGVRVLPYLMLYHGAQGRVAEFSCTVSKFQRLRDALDTYYTPICSLEPVTGMVEFPDVVAHPLDATRITNAGVVMADMPATTEELAQTPEPAGVA